MKARSPIPGSDTGVGSLLTFEGPGLSLSNGRPPGMEVSDKKMAAPESGPPG